MPTNCNLKETQELLWKLIVAPEGVPKALQAYEVPDLPIVGDRRLSNANRLDIYANMYFFRIRDSLREDFPAVVRVVGDDPFHNLVTDYLLKHPPHHWSLRYAGEALPGFVASHPFAQAHPFLPDLARIEWALLEAFDAPDGSPLGRQSLESIPPRDWGGIRFRLVPSARVYHFEWPVDTLRRSSRRVKKPRPRPTDLVVWRKGFRVFYRRHGRLEKKVLEGLSRGETFGSLCEVVSNEVGEKKAITTLYKFLRNSVEEGLLEASNSVSTS